MPDLAQVSQTTDLSRDARAGPGHGSHGRRDPAGDLIVAAGPTAVKAVDCMP
jgi:hypothetical protein